MTPGHRVALSTAVEPLFARAITAAGYEGPHYGELGNKIGDSTGRPPLVSNRVTPSLYESMFSSLANAVRGTFQISAGHRKAVGSGLFGHSKQVESR